MTAPLVEQAPAKINLTLRIGARRDDGLHALESLVAFADVADRLTLTLGRPLGLDLDGANRGACGPVADNLVLRAAQALAAQALAARIGSLHVGHFVLTKQLPVAAGLGGGSADAAAALRLLARANGLALDDPRLADAARTIGADVPVCLDPRARVMRGFGEILSAPVPLPKLAAVLVNPGVALATKEVFAAFDAAGQGGPRPLQQIDIDTLSRDRDALFAFLATQPNDLEAPAISLQPDIAEVLAALRALPQCRLARMSGSGATCFALCDSAAAAEAAAQTLHVSHPDWWICATALS
jgi:4-diphosphocytidyl-2-C-methyl-D-erythritol kinase